MALKDDIKAAKNSTDIKGVFQKIAEANTDHFNTEISAEDSLRTLILLTQEVERLNQAVVALQAAQKAATPAAPAKVG